MYKDILLLKLLKLGVTGYMFNFIKSFVTNHSFQMRVSSSLSNVRYLENGILQGSVLSSILFNKMINDLLESFQSSSALFADDLCFWKAGNDIEELNKMAPKFTE